eukprot:TRINITY_DN1185_c0_g1_i1.p1 TRINITY_DN1185_c0_g1~~TRINITY_DN1185_c0_g1_i1.p1  ORF type:complete len:655 (-),score=126.90 TRINITY_DN1185_c0_g1_i1:1575-3539(-)
MSTLVNYGGDEDFHAAGSMYSNRLDSSLLLSLGHHVDVYCPPRKRSRVVVPIRFREERIEPEKRCSIEILPDECLFEIFRRLPGNQERSACACVSKRWLMLQSYIRRSEILTSKPSSDGPTPVSITKEISSAVDEEEEQKAGSEGYLTRCLEGKKATDIRLAAIAVGSCGRGGLGKLLIRGSNATRGVTDLGLYAIARGCPSLRVLSLWNVSSISDEGLSEIAKGCHMLEKLDLSECPGVSTKGIIAIAQNCPNLMELTIESCSKIGDESLQAIGRYCPNLRSVSIKDCPLVRDQGVVSLVSSASSVLTKINLQAVNITDVSLAVMGHYGLAVTDLLLADLQNVCERGFWVMGKAVGLQKLKSLTIVSCPGLTDLGLESIGKGCPNLQHLNLKRSFISDNGLGAFTKSGASLESLQLEECNSISQLGILAVLSNCGEKLKALSLEKCLGIKDTLVGLPEFSPCKSLRSLAIRNCPGFGSFGIAMVGKLCPQLQHIDFSGLYGATDAGVIALLQSCKSGLVKVNLGGCINLSDAVVNAMARLHGGTLRLLSLEGCRKITDESMVAIAEKCPLLLDLLVSRCAVTDLGIASLAQAKHLNLRILSLSGCLQVSDNCMAFLRDLRRSLVGLNLQHCSLITRNAAELLGVQLWKCDILF